MGDNNTNTPPTVVNTQKLLMSFKYQITMFLSSKGHKYIYKHGKLYMVTY